MLGEALSSFGAGEEAVGRNQQVDYLRAARNELTSEYIYLSCWYGPDTNNYFTRLLEIEPRYAFVFLCHMVFGRPLRGTTLVATSESP
jgi:hypothetical protein